MVLAGIKVPDTVLVRDAIDLSRSASERFLFNHVMRSWLFGVLLSESVERAPDAELLAVATILHDLGLTDRYTAENRFEVDGANAARSFLKGRGISTQQMQVVWDAIALHTTRSIALHKEPEVAITHSGITADVLGVGLDRIPQDKQGAILAEFPRLALKNGLKECLCNIARRKPETTFTTSFGISAFDMSRGTHPLTLPMSSRMHRFPNRRPPDHRVAHNISARLKKETTRTTKFKDFPSMRRCTGLR